jgi:hypothetical protein
MTPAEGHQFSLEQRRWEEEVWQYEKELDWQNLLSQDPEYQLWLDSLS